MVQKQFSDKLVTREMAMEMSPRSIQETYAAISEEIKQMNELELESQFESTTKDFYLRKKLWPMIKLCSDTEQSFLIKEWLDGIVTKQHLYYNVFKNPFRFCWIFTPLSEHSDQYEDMFHLLLNKFRLKIKNLEINDDNFSATVKLLESLANRVMGPVIHRVDTRLMARHQHEVVGERIKSIEPVDIDKQLEALEQKKIEATARDVNEPE